MQYPDVRDRVRQNNKEGGGQRGAKRARKGDDPSQLFIDAGQRDFSRKTCKVKLSFSLFVPQKMVGPGLFSAPKLTDVYREPSMSS